MYAEHKSAQQYPEPPVYADKTGRKPRVQPACYLGVDPLAAMLAALSVQTNRRT